MKINFGNILFFKAGQYVILMCFWPQLLWVERVGQNTKGFNGRMWKWKYLPKTTV